MAHVDDTPLVKVEKQLECPICQEIMVLDANQPSFLDCGHIVCQGCSREMLRRTLTNYVECPQCRAHSNANITDFPTIYQLWDVAKVIESNREAFADKICSTCSVTIAFGERHFCGICHDKMKTENSALKTRYVYKKLSPYDKIMEKRHQIGYIGPHHILLGPGDTVPIDLPLVSPGAQVRTPDPTPIRHGKDHVPMRIESPVPAVAQNVESMEVDATPAASTDPQIGDGLPAQVGVPGISADNVVFVRTRQAALTARRKINGIVDLTID